jgi:hypothetical protein
MSQTPDAEPFVMFRQKCRELVIRSHPYPRGYVRAGYPSHLSVEADGNASSLHEYTRLPCVGNVRSCR